MTPRATAPGEARRRPPHLFTAGKAVLLCVLFYAAFVQDGDRSTLVARASAQQADRVVPPGAISGQMAPVDEAFALFLASSGLAQLEGARLVLKSTRDPGTTDLAQRMVRDHTSALDRLRALATQRGLELPQAPTGRHADLVTKLAGVAPAERDDAFIHRFGIDAHKEAIALTERHVKEGRDPELRRYAEALLETLRGHMAAARKLAYAAGR